MSDPDLRPGNDGEVEGGLSVDDNAKSKVKGATRWRRIRRQLRLALILIPLLAATILLTLILSGKIDLSQMSVFHGSCLAGLGKDRLTFSVGNEGENGGQIYLTNVAGNQFCPLSKPRSAVDGLNWSPNGKYLAVNNIEFEPETVNGITSNSWHNTGISLIDADGQTDRLLIPAGANPIWSPNSQYIAFIGYDSLQGVYIADMDGKNLHKVGEQATGSATYWGSWSEDSKTLSFINFQNIYTVNLDGSNLHIQLANTNNYTALMPAPDRHSLAAFGFGSVVTNTQNMYSMSSDFTNPQKLAEVGMVAGSWAPDGKELAFVGRRNTQELAEVYTVNSDGSGKAALTSDNTVKRSIPDWSPDGRYVAVLGRGIEFGTTSIYVTSVDTRIETKLTIPYPIAFGVVWQPLETQK